MRVRIRYVAIVGTGLEWGDAMLSILRKWALIEGYDGSAYDLACQLKEEEQAPIYAMPRLLFHWIWN